MRALRSIGIVVEDSATRRAGSGRSREERAMSDECDHGAAQIEHQDQSGTEVEVWVACHDCGVFWTLSGDLSDETAHMSRETWDTVEP